MVEADGRSNSGATGVLAHLCSNDVHTIEVYAMSPSDDMYAIGWSVDPLVRGVIWKRGVV